jgi:hypothetical protein
MPNRNRPTAALQRVALVAGFAAQLCIAGCGPSGEGAHHAGHALLGMHHGGLPLLHRAIRMGMRGTRVRGIRRACADDKAKFCANSGSPREERKCLEDKRDSLSAECKNALDARRNKTRDNAH